MGERLLCKQEVVGSNPITSTKLATDRDGISGGRLSGAPPASVVWHRESSFAIMDRRQACPGDRLVFKGWFSGECPRRLSGSLKI